MDKRQLCTINFWTLALSHFETFFFLRYLAFWGFKTTYECCLFCLIFKKSAFYTNKQNWKLSNPVKNSFFQISYKTHLMWNRIVLWHFLEISSEPFARLSHRIQDEFLRIRPFVSPVDGWSCFPHPQTSSEPSYRQNFDTQDSLYTVTFRNSFIEFGSRLFQNSRAKNLFKDSNLH